ncbi:MAG: isochorismate synthase [Motiliproteus sp.]
MTIFYQAIAKAIDTLCLQLTGLSCNPRHSFPCLLEHSLPLSDAPDLAAWLAAQELFPKFFWCCRKSNTQIAALGTAEAYHNQQARNQLDAGLVAQTGLRYYWLSGFDSLEQSNDTDTSAYPQQLLFLPEIALSLDRHQLSLSVTLNATSDLDALARRLRKIQPTRPLTQMPLPTSQRQDSPDFDQWQQAVIDAKHCFNQGHLQKVVLARQSTFQCPQAVDYWSLFKRWQIASINSYQIGYQIAADKGFMSFTPERLFLRDKLWLTTEAVAGTLPRSNDSAQAGEQAEALYHDSKTRHEHDLVVVEIGAKLKGLGVQISQGEGTQLLPLSGLQHLQQQIQGQLPHADMDAQLLSTLHPTAAVGGLPAERARRFIRDKEPFQRGLYAGSCGYISSARSELAVTIRSAYIDQQQLHLHAGAGIVPQSDPELEWQELEQKIALPLSLLQQS